MTSLPLFPMRLSNEINGKLFLITYLGEIYVTVGYPGLKYDWAKIDGYAYDISITADPAKV